jgi:hypothetical protein
MGGGEWVGVKGGRWVRRVLMEEVTRRDEKRQC